MKPSPPGDTIADIMAERGQDRAGVAAALRLDDAALTALLSGDLPVDLTLAIRLAAWSGASLDFWQRRERYYRHPETAAWEQYLTRTLEDWTP